MSETGTIFDIWMAAGIALLTIEVELLDFAVTMSQMKMILCENCHDGEMTCGYLPRKFEMHRETNGHAARVLSRLRR
jgi:hypothetical protein